MVVIRTVFHITGRWGVIIVLCLLANSAWAADTKDWLDEMPDVPAVVQAVRGDPSRAQFDGDDDLLAANIAGTLMLLTWVMYFQVLEDGGASPPRHPTAQWVTDNFVAGLKKMSKPRLAKLESIQESYMQAELVIGRGTGKRRGMLTTVHKCHCNTDGSFSMRVGNKTLGCYPYKFHNLLGNIYPSINHRRQILPKLFPKDRAQHYVDLVTRYVMAAPSLDEPATTLSMPDSGYLTPGSDYCSTKKYGGDSNGNGLCDDWEIGTLASAAVPDCSNVEAPSAATGKSACLSPIKPGELEAFVNNKNNEEDKGWAKLRLVGPYPCIDAAGADAVRMVRLLVDNDLAKPEPDHREFGMLIMKLSQFDDRYYLTVPVAGPPSMVYLTVPDAGPLGICADGLISPEEWEVSYRSAFLNLCDSSTNYRIVGNVHSHPVRWCDVRPSLFSRDDLDGAITGMVDDNIPLEKIFLVVANGSNYQFAPKQGDIGGFGAIIEYNNRTQLFSDNNVVCGKSK